MIKFSQAEAKKIGDKIGVDWSKIPLKEFHQGLHVELEHGSRYGQPTNVTSDDPAITGRIAHAHLLEFPDYYTRLAKMEKAAEKFWRAKS